MNAIVAAICRIIECHKNATFMEQKVHKIGISDNKALLEHMLLRTARYTHLACHWQRNPNDSHHPAAHWDITC